MLKYQRGPLIVLLIVARVQNPGVLDPFEQPKLQLGGLLQRLRLVFRFAVGEIDADAPMYAGFGMCRPPVLEMIRLV